MKRYIKPSVDIYDATMTLPLMLSLHDEVGSGQLTNEMNFEALLCISSNSSRVVAVA